MRSPAPPKGATLDHAHLKVTGPSSIDFYSYMTLPAEQCETFSYTTSDRNGGATWTVHDSTDVEVAWELQNPLRPFRLLPSLVRTHVEKNGRSRLGQWTVRLHQGTYYDDHSLSMGEGGGPAHSLDANLSNALFNIRELPSTAARVLGQMDGHSRRVTVTDKAESGGLIWYNFLELLQTATPHLGGRPHGHEPRSADHDAAANVPLPRFPIR